MFSQKIKRGNYYENLTILELLESSQITKCDGFCRNHCVLLKISKELSCKFFKVLGQVLILKSVFGGYKKFSEKFSLSCI
ncbi:hypothetical protein B2G47_19095 [Leptospira interrogans serovar Canicola]|nr:hypothetical protein B2G47_19095 [Leptospira interrogans serovar Canicola]